MSNIDSLIQSREFKIDLTNLIVSSLVKQVASKLTGHSDNRTHSLTAFDDDELLLRRGTGEHNFGVVPENLVQLIGVQFPEFGSMDDRGFSLARIYFGHRDIQPLRNVLNGLVTCRERDNNVNKIVLATRP